MRAVITVIGKDAVGILSFVSAKCAENNINILEVTQSILQELFAMIMLVDIDKSTKGLTEFSDELAALGRAKNLSIHTMHEDIFNSMHTI